MLIYELLDTNVGLIKELHCNLKGTCPRLGRMFAFTKIILLEILIKFLQKAIQKKTKPFRKG